MNDKLFASLVPHEAIVCDAVNEFTRRKLRERGVIEDLLDPTVGLLFRARRAHQARLAALSPRERWYEQRHARRLERYYRSQHGPDYRPGDSYDDIAQRFANYLFAVLELCERTYGFGLTETTCTP